MKRKPTKATSTELFLLDGQLAAARMQAIEVASRLPEAQPPAHSMMGGYPGTPGKSADKVIADAQKIIAFVMKR